MIADSRPTAVDLFSGVGGMSLGFRDAGFNVVAAFDAEARHVETYLQNFEGASAHCVDLALATGKALRRMAQIGRRSIDVVFGGPPCQGFSVGGARKENDLRNDLLLRFARLVCELRPKYFVMENVEGLMQGYGLRKLKRFCRLAFDSGFEVIEPVQVLDAASFGVPQRRRRTIVLGHRRGLTPPSYPQAKGIIGVDGKEFFPTVRDAICDLPVIEDVDTLFESDGFRGKLGKSSPYSALLRMQPTHAVLTGCLRTRHDEKTVRRFNDTKQGSAEPVSRYMRLALDAVSPTIRAGTARDKGSHTAPRPIHPTLPRCITVREAARLHSFPDWFQFHPTRWHAFRQIGNSVPPLMASAIARSIAETIIS